MKIQLVLVCTVLVMLTGALSAQDFQPAGEEWITKWWAMGLVLNNGTHAVSAATDWLAEGTGEAINQESVSTTQGVSKLRDVAVELPDNGGALEWSVFTIVPENSHNLGAVDNAEWYGVLVIDAPTQRTTTMHPTHDDYGHIWINGEKVYDNPTWTGGATTVTQPTDVDLNKGQNVLLFRCGESGGDFYINLHFEATDQDLDILPTMDDEFWEHLGAVFPVEPAGKASVVWGDLRRN